MPYRRLPNTDAARTRAMKKALEKGREVPPFRMPFSQKNLVRLQGLLPQFEHIVGLQRQAMNSQTSKSAEYQEVTRKARIYISHFMRVMNLAVLRGELPPATRTYYGIPADESTVPSLSTDNELITWGKRIIDGEDFRKKKGLTPITNPSIALVKVWFDKYLDSHMFHQTLNKRTAEFTLRTAEVRKEADELILNIWNEIEASLKDIPEEKRRTEAEKYGLVYVFRKSEMAK